jgi:hypothetical protein
VGDGAFFFATFRHALGFAARAGWLLARLRSMGSPHSPGVWPSARIRLCASAGARSLTSVLSK